MVVPGIRLQLKELPVVAKLKQNASTKKLLDSDVFRDAANFYKYIHYQFEYPTSPVTKSPSFAFAGMEVTCLALKIVAGRTVCVTEFFEISLVEALRNNELVVLSTTSTQVSGAAMPNFLKGCKEIRENLELYNLGMSMDSELAFKIQDVNFKLATSHPYYKNLLTTRGFVGGLASEL